MQMRDWISRDVEPFIDQWDENEDYPTELHQKAYRAGIYGACWPEVQHLSLHALPFISMPMTILINNINNNMNNTCGE
jgi:alkylation response protein AidB-like acyl-CoA dehydrogenase